MQINYKQTHKIELATELQCHHGAKEAPRQPPGARDDGPRHVARKMTSRHNQVKTGTVKISQNDKNGAYNILRKNVHPKISKITRFLIQTDWHYKRLNLTLAWIF